MTLIVGIKCSDGVVMGADGAATLANLGQNIIRQPIKKLQIIEPNIILGVSGHVGLSQKFKAEIEKHHATDQWHKKDPLEFIKKIRELFWPHMLADYQSAQALGPLLGGLATQEVMNETLLALPLKDSVHIYSLNKNCSSEELTEDLPFTAIGSGQNIALPFLSFLRRIFWRESELPTTGEGIFAALWTIQHAISISPGGVAEPYEIGLISQEDSHKWKAEILPSKDLDEHKQAIDRAESALRDFRNSFELKDKSTAESLIEET